MGLINDLYKTQITCEQYDSSLKHSGNNVSIEITVLLTDFDNHQPVKNRKVTLRVDKGSFSNNEKVLSVTERTNSSGVFIITYYPTEWGTATFTCNEAVTQINVNNWTMIYEKTDGGDNSVWLKIMSNGLMNMLFIRGTVGNVSSSLTQRGYIMDTSYPQRYWNGYLPKFEKMHTFFDDGIYARLTPSEEIVSDGDLQGEKIITWKLYLKSFDGTKSNYRGGGTFIYPRYDADWELSSDIYISD